MRPFAPKVMSILTQHWWRIQFYISFVMALAIGYLFASMRHKLFDVFAALSFAAVFDGALLKTMISFAAGRGHPSIPRR